MHKLLTLLGLLAVVVAAPLRASAENNLVANPSMEVVSSTGQPEQWHQGNWGTNTAQFSVVTGGAQSGERSVRVDMQSYNSGDAKWYFTPVVVTPGETYIYSDYYRATVSTTVVAQLESTSGFQYMHVGTLPSAATWTRAEFSITVPAGVSKMTVFHLISSIGRLDLDSVSLAAPSDPPPPGEGNIPNPSLEERSSTGQPAFWTKGQQGSLRLTFSYLSTGHTGSRSVRAVVKSYKSGEAKWQHTPVPVVPSKTYQVSDWYQSTVDTFAVVEVTLNSGAKQHLELGRVPKASGWTKYTGEWTAPSNAVSAVFLHVLRSNGSLTTDDYALAEYTPPVGFDQGMVSLTFDDGWASFATAARPILEAKGMKATAYLVSGFTGLGGYLTADQVWALRAAGHEIASHTVTHPSLPSLTTAEISAELTNAKATLEQFGGVVENFASPYGEMDDRSLTLIKNTYASHRGIEKGYNTKGQIDPYNLKIQHVLRNTSLAEVTSWIDQAKINRTWLILMYHQIDTTNSEYGTTPTLLQAHVNAMETKGVAVKTVEEALTIAGL